RHHSDKWFSIIVQGTRASHQSCRCDRRGAAHFAGDDAADYTSEPWHSRSNQKLGQASLLFKRHTVHGRNMGCSRLWLMMNFRRENWVAFCTWERALAQKQKPSCRLMTNRRVRIVQGGGCLRRDTGRLSGNSGKRSNHATEFLHGRTFASWTAVHQNPRTI